MFAPLFLIYLLQPLALCVRGLNCNFLEAGCREGLKGVKFFNRELRILRTITAGALYPSPGTRQEKSLHSKLRARERRSRPGCSGQRGFRTLERLSA